MTDAPVDDDLFLPIRVTLGTVRWRLCTVCPNHHAVSSDRVDAHRAWLAARDDARERARDAARRPTRTSGSSAGASRPDVQSPAVAGDVARLTTRIGELVAAGATRAELATRLGVSLARLDRWRRGDVRPGELDELTTQLD